MQEDLCHMTGELETKSFRNPYWFRLSASEHTTKNVEENLHLKSIKK